MIESRLEELSEELSGESRSARNLLKDPLWSEDMLSAEAFESLMRPRTPTASSILKFLEEGGDQSGRDFSDRDHEYFMTLLEEESS